MEHLCIAIGIADDRKGPLTLSHRSRAVRPSKRALGTPARSGRRAFLQRLPRITALILDACVTSHTSYGPGAATRRMGNDLTCYLPPPSATPIVPRMIGNNMPANARKPRWHSHFLQLKFHSFSHTYQLKCYHHLLWVPTDGLFADIAEIVRNRTRGRRARFYIHPENGH